MQLQSEQIHEIALALSKCQAEITFAVKDSTNPFYKSKYADLTSVWEACREPLTHNDLAVLQQLTVEDDKPYLITTLVHKSGQWFKSKAPLKPNKDDIQGLGIAITYMRRYSLTAIVGITQDDDDGNGAVKPPKSFKYEAPKMQISAPPIPDRIVTEKEAEDLQSLFDACSSDFQENFNSYLSKELKINSLQNLAFSRYSGLRIRFINEAKKTGTEA